jgi:hypothetical protein
MQRGAYRAVATHARHHSVLTTVNDCTMLDLD